MDRVRQVLGAVEDRQQVAREELTKIVDRSTCTVGHEFRWAFLSQGLLESQADGFVALAPAGGEWLMEHGRPPPDWKSLTWQSGQPLRDWQVQALDAWVRHGRRGVVQAVTGTGKSRVGIEAVREALTLDYSAVIAVPSLALVEQWVKALKAAGVKGVLSSTEGLPLGFRHHQVIVATVQALYQCPPQRDDGKVLLVADECHRYGAEQWSRILDPSYRWRLGLTATFERNDDGLGRLVSYFEGQPVYEIDFTQAIDEGVVAHFDVGLLGVDLTPRERTDYDEADSVVRDTRVKLLAADFPSEPFGAFLHEVQKAAESDEDPTIEDAARLYLKAFSRRIDIMTGAEAKLEVVPQLAPVVNASGGTLLFTRRVDIADEIARRL